VQSLTFSRVTSGLATGLDKAGHEGPIHGKRGPDEADEGGSGEGGTSTASTVLAGGA
jgi:hypothetical protein